MCLESCFELIVALLLGDWENGVDESEVVTAAHTTIHPAVHDHLLSYSFFRRIIPCYNRLQNGHDLVRISYF